MPLAYATELSSPDDQLVGWGLKLVIDGAREAGWDVVEVPHPNTMGDLPAPDVWLCSLPYAGNIRYIKEFFTHTAKQDYDRKGRDGRTVFLLGGHAVVNTKPLLDVFDACFVGEADYSMADIMAALPSLDSLAAVPGVHVADRNETVVFQLAKDLGKRAFYKASYNDEGGRDKTIYLEIARGCQQGCRFCELGWAYGQNYTRRTREETEALMDEAVRRGYERKNIVLSAPDTDGVPWLSDMMQDGSYTARWRSTRVRPYLKTPELPWASGRGRIRFGIEGVNERLRTLAGKRITDEEVQMAIERSKREGYRMVRLFFIAGLPTETQIDRMHLDSLLDMFRRARHWAMTDVKITGLSPQPFTPWQRTGVKDALEALDGYRQLRRMKEKHDVAWRNVMVDAQCTEADVLKMMGPGELLRYLRVRPEGDVPGPANQRWRVVAGWCKEAGISYRNVLRQYDLDEPLPWDHVIHPMADRLRRAEVRAWDAIRRELAP